MFLVKLYLWIYVHKHEVYLYEQNTKTFGQIFDKHYIYYVLDYEIQAYTFIVNTSVL